MFTPTNETEVQEAILGTQGALNVRAGGTRPIGRMAPGQVLSLAGLNGITLYEPGALTLVAQAGTPLEEIDKALQAEGQQLPFEPMDHCGLLGTQGASTIGGVVAGNISGPRRVQVGACRDFLLGVRFVDGHGQAIKNGGRVMKNVTGYDLARLLAGSWGTLGVLTEVSLKVLPRPETFGTVVLNGLEPVGAVAAMSAALGSPYDVSGAAFINGQTVIRVEGFEESVRYRMDRLAEMLTTYGVATFLPDAKTSAPLWQSIRDVTPFHDQKGEVWRLSVKPGDAPNVLAALPGCQTILDWGGGLIWLLVPAAAGLGAAQIRAALPAGHATRIRGDHGPDTFHPRPAAIAAIEAGLRTKFDPDHRFNPGLMEG